MNLSETRAFPLRIQTVICLALVLLVSGICFYLQTLTGYRVIALLLLTTVSVIAMLFDIVPVVTAAILSALIWNFFFIPPLFTFHIDEAEDVLLFFLYFLIALINTVLTFKIRDAEKKARDKEEKDNIIRLYHTLFNSLSHELRTPISTIIGALDTFKENQKLLSSADQAELLSVIDKAAIRLNREVENLLNMGRLESGMLKPKIDWCDLEEIVHGVIRNVCPSGEKTITFLPGEDLPLFRLDAGLIGQVIHNLLHNAIQHTPSDTLITIQVEHSEGFCVMIIRDNGPGFPEKEIPMVFEKFYLVSHSRRGGSGLGLSIVKGFVEAHQGVVTLRNLPAGGAEFTIRIPAGTTYINQLKNE